MDIVAIVGSPRSNGNTNYLADQALAQAVELGAKTEKILVNEYRLNPCLGHDNCASLKNCLQNDDDSRILERFRSADGIIIATPVYYYNMTAQMKTFIDRNYFFYRHKIPYKARAAGIIVVATEAGISDTLETVRKFVNLTGVPGEKTFATTGYADKIGDAARNPMLVESARNLGRLLTEACK